MLATKWITIPVPTFPQYREQRRNEVIAEYGITGSEFKEFYPDHSLLPEWRQSVEAAVNSGVTLTPAACDSYCRHFTENGFLRTFRGVWANGIPEGYLPPSVRNHNKELHAELVAARKRGRSASQKEEVK